MQTLPFLQLFCMLLILKGFWTLYFSYLVEFGYAGEYTRKRHVDFSLMKEIIMKDGAEPLDADRGNFFKNY